MCEKTNCVIKFPCFNYSGEIKGLYCKKHKLDGMIDLINKICLEHGCNIQSTYNYPCETKALCCAKHRLDGMINVIK